MRKYVQVTGIVFLGAVVELSSCKKESKDDNGTAGTKDILTSGSWKTTTMTPSPGIDYGGFEVTDLLSIMPTCAKDDLYKILSDGVVIFDEGANICDPSNPHTSEGSWTLSDDNKTLTIKEEWKDDIVVAITGITSTMVKGIYTMTEDFGAGMQTYSVSITMVKQ